MLRHVKCARQGKKMAIHCAFMINGYIITLPTKCEVIEFY